MSQAAELEGQGRGWGTRLGFYLAAIGSAFGLGNLWRFPYVVSENGGGAFVLLYIGLVFLLGLPLLVAELLLGKTSRSGLWLALESLASGKDSSGAARRPLNWVTHFAPVVLLICVLVLAYYAVISGWVLHFFMQFLVPFFSAQSLDPQRSLEILMNNGWLQAALASVHLLVVAVIVARDVEEGIERWLGFMMPVFVLLLFILAAKSLSLESAPEALRFLFYPDFSQLSFSSLGQAVGHLFFTLSVGFGTMVTFGSYLQKRSYVPIAGFRVATLDSMISLFAGVLIFPLVLVTVSVATGPELLFQTVPNLFLRIQGGHLFGLGFFICLYLAALGASIGLLETIVANLRDKLKWSRPFSAMVAALLCWLLALLPALSSTLFKGFRFRGQGLLEVLDGLLINWMLPVTALIVSQLIYYRLERKKLESEFIDPESLSSVKLYSHWMFVLRYVAPTVIGLALLLQVWGLWVD